MSIIVMRGEGGGEILVEVSDDSRLSPRGNFRGDDAEGISDRAMRYVQDFGQVGSHIMNVCSEIYSKYQSTSAAARPNDLEIKFGIKIGGETGIPFVSKGVAEASIEVTARWKQKDVS